MIYINEQELLKKLVSIPSYFDKNQNEKEIGNFVFDYLKQFPFLKVFKQNFSKNRFNIVAITPGKPKILVGGHLDTVEPKHGWATNQFKATVKDDKLFGLGCLDTKGGVASILMSLSKFKEVCGLTLLFYGDEEYDFLGMKKFVNSSRDKIGEIAILTEPTNLQIFNMHRGIIEIEFSIFGKTGHSGNPSNGKNAINKIMDIIRKIDVFVSNHSDLKLGKSTFNIAYIKGGLYINKDDSEVSLGKQGNNIADYAETVIEIRPSCQDLMAKKVVDLIKREVNKSGYKIDKIFIRHDFGSLNADANKLKNIENILKKENLPVKYVDPSSRGYGDGQLLQEKYKIPVMYLGPGGENAHGANEYVETKSLIKLSKLFFEIIKKYCRTK